MTYLRLHLKKRAGSRSRLLQESQAEGEEHQDDADIRDEPIPEPVSEEQEIDGNDDDYHGYDAQREKRMSCHCLKLYQIAKADPFNSCIAKRFD
jgi:hypothetical protein